MTYPVTTWKGEPVRVTMSGQAGQVWAGNNQSPPILIYNFDPVNPIYVGYQNNIAINGNNTQYVPPQYGLTMDGTRSLYAIGVAGAGPLQVTPGGGAPFQQPSVSLINLGAVKIFTTTTAPTQPPNIPLNSLWFAPNGSIQVWNGSAWVPYQFNAQQIIQASSITASEIAAGTVVAGIVNGTLIEAAQFVAYGNQGEFYVYSATPATGNLIASVAGIGGVDNWPGGPATNAVLQGIASYNGVNAAQMAAGAVYLYSSTTIQATGGGNTNPAALNADTTYPGVVHYWSGMANNVDAQAYIIQVSSNTGFPGRLFTVGNTEIDLTAQYISLGGNQANPTVYIPAGGGPFIQSGIGWQQLSLPSGITGTWRVKLLPWNAVWMDIQITVANATGTTYTTGGLPTAAHYPAATMNREVVAVATPSSVQGPARVFIPSTIGAGVQLITPTMSAGGYIVGGDIMYPNN